MITDAPAIPFRRRCASSALLGACVGLAYCFVRPGAESCLGRPLTFIEIALLGGVLGLAIGWPVFVLINWWKRQRAG